MPAPDLRNMTILELKDLIANAEAAIVSKTEQENAKFLEDMRREAEKRGVDFEAVVGGGASKKRAPAKPQFRNPSNANQTWSGRGRAPSWAEPYKDAGTLEEIRIKD